MADRIEWPSGLRNAEEMVAGAGRIEQQLNANGDPTYIGYAPRTDSPSHLPGWLIELRVYNASNKMIGAYRTIQYSWNDRTLLTKPPISPAPVFGQIRINAAAQPGIFYKRGSGVGQITIQALAPLPVVIVRGRTVVSQITITQFLPYYGGAYLGGFRTWKTKAGIAVGSISMGALAVPAIDANPAIAVGSLQINAFVSGEAV